MKFISVMCYDHFLKLNEEMLVCVDFIICVSRSCSEDKSLFYLNLTNQAGTSIQSIFMTAKDRDAEFYRIKDILMHSVSTCRPFEPPKAPYQIEGSELL